MAIIDIEREVIVVRIVYEGPPLSGKTTSIQALSQLLGRTAQVFSPEMTQEKRLHFDWMEYIGGFFRGYSISCQIVGVPGQLFLEMAHHFLLHHADVVIFVLDANNDPEELLKDFKTLQEELIPLGKEAPIKVIIQANKQDEPQALPTSQLRQIFAAYPEIKIVESAATLSQGVREAFVLAVRLAVERASILLAKGLLKYGKPDRTFDKELREVTQEIQKFTARTQEIKVSSVPLPKGSQSLPPFPDQSIAPQWIWPPLGGRELLNMLCQYPLRPSLQDHLWTVKIDKLWRGFSKSQWQYSDLEQARLAFREHIGIHLQCSPLLSEHRAIIVAEKSYRWYLWQIVQHFPTLADSLEEAWQTGSPNKIASEIFRCAVYYVEALHQCLHLPLQFNLLLENLGKGRRDELIYLGPLEKNPEAIKINTTEEHIVNGILQTFTAPLNKALQIFSVERTEIINELKKIDSFEQKYIIEVLLQLLSSLEIDSPNR